MKTLICALVFCSAPMAFANTITCSNSSVKITATLSEGFNLSDANYLRKEGTETQVTPFKYGKPAGRVVTRGPDQGKIEFQLGLLDNCNAYLRIPAEAPFAAGTLRRNCPDGGDNVSLTCRLR